MTWGSRLSGVRWQFRQTAFYEPAHDSEHDPLAGRVTHRLPGLESVGDDGQGDGGRGGC
jgi:hypothetical protein